MSRIEQVKSLVRVILKEHKARTDADHADAMIEAMLSELQSTTGLDRSELENHISGFELKVREAESLFTSYQMTTPGHGPIKIPHKCHKTATICFVWPPPPAEPEYEICIEIEYPWPCPKLT